MVSYTTVKILNQKIDARVIWTYAYQTYRSQSDVLSIRLFR